MSNVSLERFFNCINATWKLLTGSFQTQNLPLYFVSDDQNVFNSPKVPWVDIHVVHKQCSLNIKLLVTKWWNHGMYPKSAKDGIINTLFLGALRKSCIHENDSPVSEVQKRLITAGVTYHLISAVTTRLLCKFLSIGNDNESTLSCYRSASSHWLVY